MPDAKQRLDLAQQSLAKTAGDRIGPCREEVHVADQVSLVRDATPLQEGVYERLLGFPAETKRFRCWKPATWGGGGGNGSAVEHHPLIDGKTLARLYEVPATIPPRFPPGSVARRSVRDSYPVRLGACSFAGSPAVSRFSKVLCAQISLSVEAA